MRLRRTANAGVLLTLDGITVLLDGVCKQRGPYYGTPEAEIQALLACAPDITAFTHGHLDHFDREFAHKLYKKTLRSILGPEGLLKEGLCCGPVSIGGVTVGPVPSRHIGKSGQGIDHVSYRIEGSKHVIFAGDAAPTQFRDLRADVLIAPYAWAITSSAWHLASQVTKKLVLVHLPPRENDPAGLWRQVESVTRSPGPDLYIPDMGENLTF